MFSSWSYVARCRAMNSPSANSLRKGVELEALPMANSVAGMKQPSSWGWSGAPRLRQKLTVGSERSPPPSEAAPVFSFFSEEEEAQGSS